MIIEFINIVITSITFILVINNLVANQIKLKTQFILLLILPVIGIIDFYYFHTIFIPLSTLLLFSYLFFILKEKFFKSLVSSILTPTIVIICDFILGYSFMNLFNLSYMEIRSTLLIQLPMCLILLIISHLLSTFIGMLFSKDSTLFTSKNVSSKLVLILIINISSAFIVMYFFVFYLRTLVSSNAYVNFITIVSIIYALSTFIAIVFYGMYIKKDTELVQKNIETKQLQEYTDMIEYMYTDIRKFKHDYVNLLSSINGYIEMDQLGELKEFFNNKILPMSASIDKDSMKLSSLHNLQCIPLKGLLSSKLLLAQNKKMDVLIDIVEDVFISEESVAVLDLCRIVGILIDNALESAYETNDKVIQVALINKNNSLIIIVLNSITSDIPPIGKMFKKGFSTKGSNRGLGLSTVNSVVKSYDNISLNTYIDNSTFTQELTIIKK